MHGEEGKDKGGTVKWGEMMQEKIVLSENGVIHYWTGGCSEKEADCIVFVHGMLADHTMFSEQIKFFSKQYKIIAIDVPLHGKSRRYEDFTFERVAKEIKKILDTERVLKAIFIGQSMGGYICQQFALLFSDNVKAFISVDSHPFGHNYYHKWERKILSRAGHWTGLLPYQLFVQFIARNVSETKETFLKTVDFAAQYSRKELIGVIDHVLKEFVKQKNPVSFTFPVLLIVGANEITGFIKKYNFEWARREGYPISIINQAAHNVNMDNVNEFNAVVDAFLKQI